ICHCGRKATMVARVDENGNMLKEGAQLVVGGNDMYVSLCRKHYMAGDLGPDFKK
ncbi:MAG: thymidine kinase, partial [Firmicutes bacterium]|nr:thymidine kinase [Bacillota bacterium]